MLSAVVFVLLLAVFLGVVWYAVSREDLMSESGKPRFGALSRAFHRVRKRRSARQWGVFDHHDVHQPVPPHAIVPLTVQEIAPPAPAAVSLRSALDE